MSEPPVIDDAPLADPAGVRRAMEYYSAHGWTDGLLRVYTTIHDQPETAYARSVAPLGSGAALGGGGAQAVRGAEGVSRDRSISGC